MDESRILTSEEVDAILKATKEQNQDLSSLVTDQASVKQDKTYTYALVNINEVTRAECEKNLSSFLRKKILIKTKLNTNTYVAKALEDIGDKKIFSMFRVLPNNYFGIFVLDLSLLHQSINLLFGGKLNVNEPVIENPGKIGTIVAEKICQLFLSGFAQGFQEYGELNCEIIKTTRLVNLVTSMGMSNEDPIVLFDWSIFLDEIETPFQLLLSEELLNQIIPPRKEDNRHREKDFWKTAIKTQVVDSLVTVNVTLPDVSIRVNDFMALKEGDVIPISDPTLVYICLNSIKLFRASAGQANSKRVAKITSQI